MSQIAKVKINLEYLRRLLKLPDTVRFIKVRQDWNMEQMCIFEVLVESPDLQEVPEYSQIPEATIRQHSEFCTSDEITHVVCGELKQL